MAKPFKGEIKLDTRDATPDWNAFLPEKAPEGAPRHIWRQHWHATSLQ